MMSDFDITDGAFSRFSVEIKTIFLALSITFYYIVFYTLYLPIPYYIVFSIISDNKADNIR